jgi:hypothetical protein
MVCIHRVLSRISMAVPFCYNVGLKRSQPAGPAQLASSADKFATRADFIETTTAGN